MGPSETEALVSGEAEEIGEAQSKLRAIDASGTGLISEMAPIPNQEAAVARIGKFLADSKFPTPVAIGHRVVHGGPDLLHHCIINGDVLKRLEDAPPSHHFIYRRPWR